MPLVTWAWPEVSVRGQAMVPGPGATAPPGPGRCLAGAGEYTEKTRVSMHLPQRGRFGDLRRPIPEEMPQTQALIAALVAAVSGYAVLRTGRTMLGAGVDLNDGGGWAVLLILEACVSFAAVGVALS